eukprot:6520026-Pyramimonas_sp.AAC.1
MHRSWAKGGPGPGPCSAPAQTSGVMCLIATWLLTTQHLHAELRIDRLRARRGAPWRPKIAKDLLPS